MVAGVGFNSAQLIGMRMLAEHQAAQSRALERLSTGQRINRAKDDPAGLIASNHLGAQASGVRGEINRLERESLVLGSREGALSVIDDLLGDLNGAIVQAANRDGTSDEEKEAIQIDAESVVDGIAHILSTSRFQGEFVFTDHGLASLGTIYRSAPAAPAGPTDETGVTGRFGSDGLPGGGDDPAPVQTVTRQYTLDDLKGALNLVDGDIGGAQDLISEVQRRVTTWRADLGAQQKNFYTPRIRSLEVELEGTLEARSRIRDTDFAKETAEFVRSQVLASAATIVIQRSSEIAAKTVLGLLG